MNKDPSVARGHGWLTLNLVSQLAFGLLAMTICIPSMQDWPATFGASQAAVQLTFSAFVAAYGGMQLVWGPWSDRAGRKTLLLVGLVLACAASLLAAFAPNLTVLTIARLLQGAGAAAGTVISRALVQDLFTGNERTRRMAFIGMAMGVTPALAMVLGGQMHVHLGWRSIFLLMAALAVALFIGAWRGLPPDQPSSERQARGARELLAGYGRLLREPGFMLHVAILVSTTATFYTFLGGAPVVYKAYGVTPERVGWYIMCVPLAYMVGNYVTTRVVRRVSTRRIMAMGQACTVGGIVIVLLLGFAGVYSPLAVSVPLILLGIGHGLLAPPTLAGTVGLVPALAGAAAAVAGVMQQMSGAFGAWVIGLVPHEGHTNLAWLMLAWTLLGVVAQALLHRRR
ncbi:MAG TPA: Bcr/CflA family efflux MFS transporter [Ramlibacter sp.]|jgi:DHA1 family bicyclomycin/chloramphenicol resistance-like MFS transporter|nr:Bcr/CflA family efflux MFS transporter [Ramlibacter sp.]